jgi:hypothetical protein
MRSLRRLLTSGVFATLLPLSPAAQPAADPWQPLLGAWRGPGLAMARPAVGDAHWERVLGGRFVRLTMSFTPAGAPAPAFFGHAYYSTTDSTGHWIDSQGAHYTLTHATIGDTLRVRYMLASGAAAESVYWPERGGTLVERSRIEQPTGEWKDFLAYRFTRVAASSSGGGVR